MIIYPSVNLLRLKSNGVVEMLPEIKSDNYFHKIKFPIKGCIKPNKSYWNSRRKGGLLCVKIYSCETYIDVKFSNGGFVKINLQKKSNRHT